MKIFIHVAFILLFIFSDIYASDAKEIKKIILKKDEPKKILVKYGLFEKLFKFRWTLYANGGLVVFRSYDKIVAQNILYLRHQNQAFRFNLKARGISSYNVPYIIVQFKEFNHEKNEATFELLLFDEESEMKLKYLKKVEEG